MIAVAPGQLGVLVRSTVRTLPWPSMLGVIGAVAALTAVTHAMHGADATRGLLPVAAVVLSAGAGSVIGEGSRDLLHSVPTPWWVRGGLRVAAGSLLALLAWSSLAGYASIVAGDVHLTEWGLRLVVLTAVSVACCLRWGAGAALSASLVAIVTALKMPFRWRLVVPYDDPGYAAAQGRWLAVGLVAAIAIGAALRDPARRPGR